jgi:regulator of sigma E protease
MNEIFGFLYSYILPTIIVLGVLIWIHELGHFMFAKIVGIRVERFSMGFPPRLFGKKIGDTDYCISAIPFGGYVKMSGMIDESMDNDGIKGEPWEFMSKPIWARFLVIFAGPAFNLLLAVAIFGIGIYVAGIAEPVGPIVGNVMEESPAKQIGLIEGDVIQKVGDVTITEWDDILNIVHNSAGKELTIQWLREGEILTSVVTPKLEKIQDVGLIGIGPKSEIRRPGLIEATSLGVKAGWDLTKLMGRSFSLMFKGEIPFAKNLAGPIRIGKMAGDSAKRGIYDFLSFIALLSLNLGFINLLPFPVLDGGHLVFLGIEGIIRRPISVKIKIVFQQIGMAILLALMIFVIFNDVSNLF